ncbi:MAG: hypothetical protein ABJA85_01325 [Bacteroidota bacterium]
MNKELIPAINDSLEISISDTISLEELKKKMIAHINHLINHDFEKLVFYLYRIDVNENKMKQLLEQKEGENAAGLITDLIIERQLEKIKSRRKFNQRDNNIEENEKW